MRVLAFVLVATLLAAGCVSQGGVVDPASDDDGEVGVPASPTPTPTPGSPSPSSPTPSSPPNASEPSEPKPAPAEEEAPTFCEAEEGCTFWDDDYHEYVLYDVDTTVVDVLIVPSASPMAIEDTAAMRAAIDAWAAGIEALGQPWFAGNFTLRVYTLGTDVPPQEAVDDPEIVVVAAEYNPALLFGIGYQLPSLPCRGGEALHTYPTHEHDGMQIFAAQCESGGLTCVALNTNFLLGGAMRLYDLVAHEFGHCLGGGHVGDAMDFSAKRVPVKDIMSYQDDPEQVHCVSNLNLRTLEALYAPLLGVDLPLTLAAGDFYTMPRAQYAQVACENPG